MKYLIQRQANNCGTNFWCVFGPYHGMSMVLLSKHYTWQKAMNWLENWQRKRTAA